MSFNTRLLASCVAAAAIMSGAQALAADYDPPIFVEQAPEWVPVEIGSGWYLRGDVSYNTGKLVNDLSPARRNTQHARFGGDVGVGYHFNDFLRGDVTIGYLGGDELDWPGLSAMGTRSHGMWNGLVNAYADLGTVVGLTPYVGVGAGVTSSRRSGVESWFLNPPSSLWNRTQYNLTYALMAGASYKVTDNASIDAGYRFLHTPGMEYFDSATDEFRKGVQQHQIRVGLRYELW
jgi:opacity protein-like surface antigen